MLATDIPEQLVLRGTSDKDVPAILTQFRKLVELKGDLHVPPRRDKQINKGAVRFPSLLFEKCSFEDIQSVNTRYA